MKIRKFILMTAATALLLSSCGSVPITGRKQLNLVSDAEILQSSLQQYAAFMNSAPRSTKAVQSEQVTRVGTRIAAATEAYLRSSGLESELQNYQWEFNLVKDDQINAFCMPGGKIVVYEGIMNLVESDDDLAVVLGHEVAHAVAKHANERMSQEMLAQYGQNILGAVISGASYETQAIAQTVYGLGAQYGAMLPFSRKHETEADDMGLVLMTMAGYNPENAITFWQKMSASSSSSTPEFLSTHPSDKSRISNLQKRVPQVKQELAPYLQQTQQTQQTKSASSTTKKTTTYPGATQKSTKK